MHFGRYVLCIVMCQGLLVCYVCDMLCMYVLCMGCVYGMGCVYALSDDGRDECACILAVMFFVLQCVRVSWYVMCVVCMYGMCDDTGCMYASCQVVLFLLFIFIIHPIILMYVWDMYVCFYASHNIYLCMYVCCCVCNCVCVSISLIVSGFGCVPVHSIENRSNQSFVA